MAHNLIWHEADEEVSDQQGLTYFLDGTLRRIMGGELSLERLAHPNYRGLIDTLEATLVDNLAYKNAIIAYFEALVRDQDEWLDALARWR